MGVLSGAGPAEPTPAARQVPRKPCATQVSADYEGLQGSGDPQATAPATQVGELWAAGHPTTHRWVQHY